MDTGVAEVVRVQNALSLLHRHLQKAGRRGSTASRRGRHRDIRAVQGTAGLHGRGRDREASPLKESQQEIGLA